MLQHTEHALVALARQAIRHYLTAGAYLTPPAELAIEWRSPAATFVSLKRQGALRGCIGTCVATQPNVILEIIQNAVSAATADPRFPPVILDEMEGIDISVDILLPPERVENEAQLDPKRYGVIVRAGKRGGVLLPDIPQILTVERQMAIVRLKAGIRPDEPVELYRFEVMRHH